MAGPAGGGAQAFASTLTDLMTSLAVIFILLLVVFLKQSHDQSKKAKEEVTGQLQELLEQKSLALKQDPEDPLTLSVKLGEDQLRFPVGSASLTSKGSEFIGSFFQNFASKICQPALREKLDSIVIEGHTDQSGEKTPDGVRKNIALSQRRSFTVLEQALRGVQIDPASYECLLKLASASGRGSRNPVTVAGVYNPDLSRRVEIKIRVRSAEQQFKSIIQTATAGQPQSGAAPQAPAQPQNAPAPQNPPQNPAAPQYRASPQNSGVAPAPVPVPAQPRAQAPLQPQTAIPPTQQRPNVAPAPAVQRPPNLPKTQF